MIHRHHYRTFVLASLAATAIFGLSACGPLTHHETIKEEQTNRWNQTRIGVLQQLAQQQYQVGDYDKCKETLTQAYRLNFPYAPIEILAARVDLEKGSLESASAHLQTAIQLDVNNPEPYYLLGVVYQRWQNSQTAHDYYHLAFEKKPTEARYLLAVAEMKITLGQHDEAQKLLEDKLVYFEQTAAIRVALGKLYTLKGDHAAACKFYREASLLSTDDQSIRQDYATSLFFAGRYAEALPILEDLHRTPNLQDKSDLRSLLGQTYLYLHRPRDARSCFAELARERPYDTGVRLNLGKATLQLEDLNQAASIARGILKTEPDNVQALILLGLTQQKQKQWTPAQDTLARAHQLAPKDTTILCLLGLSAQRLGQPAQAVDLYHEALAVKPNDPWAQELLTSAAPARFTPDAGK